MSIRTAVISHLRRVAAEQNKTLATLVDDTPLLETGLDSLCFAILVARLEEDTGADPFVGDVQFPSTVGELISLYENHGKQVSRAPT